MKIECAHDKVVDIDLLVPNPRNANDHPEAQIKLLAKIMMHQGWRNPIVVSNRSGFITKGHGRLMAAKLNGWTQAPVDYQDYASEADEWADMIADNKIAELAESNEMRIQEIAMDLGPDFDFDLFGIPNFQIIGVDTLPPGADEDAVPSLPVEPKSKLGDIYKLGRHRLMCGNSADVISIDKLCIEKKPLSVVTDPPYGIGIDGQKASVSANPKHNRKAHEFRGWDNERPDEGIFNYIAGLGVPAVIWGGNYFADLLPATRGWIYWNKGQDGLTMSDGELAWTTESTPLRAVTVNRGALKGSVHPTQKPLQVIEHSLEYIKAESSVLDLFGGSGTTLIACEKTGRSCLMMELDPRYCDVIVARWEQYTGKRAILLSGEVQDEQYKAT